MDPFICRFAILTILCFLVGQFVYNLRLRWLIKDLRNDAERWDKYRERGDDSLREKFWEHVHEQDHKFEALTRFLGIYEHKPKCNPIEFHKKGGPERND